MNFDGFNRNNYSYFGKLIKVHEMLLADRKLKVVFDNGSLVSILVGESYRCAEPCSSTIDRKHSERVLAAFPYRGWHMIDHNTPKTKQQFIKRVTAGELPPKKAKVGL